MILTYCVDIDGTICKNNNKYENSVPYTDRILQINNLYDQGHIIKYFTARGMGRHKDSIILAQKDFFDITYNQLNSWGCKFHSLILGKPSADFYIDDKSINDKEFFKDCP